MGHVIYIHIQQHKWCMLAVVFNSSSFLKETGSQFVPIGPQGQFRIALLKLLQHCEYSIKTNTLIGDLRHVPHAPSLYATLTHREENLHISVIFQLQFPLFCLPYPNFSFLYKMALGHLLSPKKELRNFRICIRFLDKYYSKQRPRMTINEPHITKKYKMHNMLIFKML